MTPLCELADKFKTDKHRPHNYTSEYYRLFADRRNDVKRVLEVGIRYGASLRMWEAFFPNAEIVGIDRHPGYLIQEGRIKTYVGNQAKPEKLTKVMQAIGGKKFDLIVDDGSHKPQKQINCMIALLPFLRDDGVYTIEDIRGDGDLEVIQSHVPAWLKTSVFVGSKPHPKHGREKMLIITA